ncbi:MAG: DNA polymerase III subunit gamma/tau [Proteobacteria bacterium]|nr:DNA polymerase III subunit gamma/tau [Pseudomonadota bacterium]
MAKDAVLMADTQTGSTQADAKPTPAPAGDTQTPTKPTSTSSYRVLARKYRPHTIDELIGQESLVTTLNNALAMGRLAHAFILTGLRGIGKTTTARIIAKGLNCTGPDGTGKPTMNPCGECASCVGIAHGRHVDVIEMDAASHTGVDDIREIIDGVSYAPLSARHKIYIIDEVHMLSKSAFNALLKTLEEPPPSVIFVFATTEVRKVPVTVLSRCQRFDLKRVPAKLLADHLQNIATKESIKADPAALYRIARAAEGSVRDALSLLDQAAALTKDTIDDAQTATMLGQAGRMDALAIAKAVLAGDAVTAAEGLATATSGGAEPVMVMGDILEFIHYASRVVLAKGDDAIVLGDLPDAEAEALRDIAAATSIARLARAWQIGIKGYGEINTAPNPHAAADMVLIRIAHASSLPPPADIIKKLSDTKTDSSATPPANSSANPPASTPSASAETKGETPSETEGDTSPSSSPPPSPEFSTPTTPTTPTAQNAPDALNSSAPTTPQHPPPHDMRSLYELFDMHGEQILASKLYLYAKPISVTAGRFEFASNTPMEDNFSGDVARLLKQWTGLNWLVEQHPNSTSGGETLETLDNKHDKKLKDLVTQDPKVQQILQSFPDIAIKQVRAIADVPAQDTAQTTSQDTTETTAEVNGDNTTDKPNATPNNAHAHASAESDSMEGDTPPMPKAASPTDSLFNQT